MENARCRIVLITWSPDDYRLNLLKGTIATLRKHTLYPYRLTIVDNGTGAQTEYIRSIVPDVHIINKTNTMPGTARNQGAGTCDEEYIAFIDNDLSLTRNWLTKCINLLNEYPEKKLITTPVSTSPMRLKTEGGKAHRFAGTLPNGCNLYTVAASMCLVMRTESFREIGLWPIETHEDYLWAKMARGKGYLYALLKKPCVKHRGRIKSFHLRDRLINGKWEQDLDEQRQYWKWLWKTRAGMNINKHQDIYSAVRPYLKGKIVDLGYGVTDLYKEDTYDVTGIDLSPVAQEKMQKKFPFGDWRVGDVRRTGLPDNCADIVLLVSTIEHFHDYEPVLKEAKRICKGKIVIVVPMRNFDRDHRHPVWLEDRVKSLSNTLGDINYYEEPRSQSWIIVTEGADGN